VQPVGSYCTDMSRCTVNKTLNFPFHHHVDYVIWESVKLLAVFMQYNLFFSFHPLFLVVIFYFKSKLDQAFVIWNSITSADASKAEYIHRNFHLSVLVVSSHTSIQVCRYIRLLKIAYFTWEAASTFWTLFVLLFTSALNSAVSFRHDWHSNFYSKSYKISYFTVRSTWKNIQLCLDSHRLLMLSLATSMYLKLLTAIVFYIDCDKFFLTEVSFS
jgi:hypothetical protein